jgi:predicted AlkP superfamily phosphohydrolase/phosphomutase
VVQGTPFWVQLSDAGKRVAVFDVPHSYLTKGINGIQTVEWAFHDKNYGFQAWPEEVKDEILRDFGSTPHSWNCNQSNRTPAQFAAFRDMMVRSIRKKTDLTKHFLSKGDWDLVVQIFTESHCVGHQCWHLNDPGFPNYDPAVTAVTNNPMLDVYKAIDQGVGELVDMVGEDTTVFVVASHGMMQKRGADFLVPEILLRLGYAKPVPSDAQPDKTMSERVETAMMGVWRAMPDSARERLDTLRGRVRRHFDLQKNPLRSPLDLPSSQCFHVDNGAPISGIRINLKGREPAGLIEPGADYDAFCERLIADLMEIVHVDTGEPLIRAVHRTEDLTTGPERDALPDLIIDWSDRPVGSATVGNKRGSHLTVRSSKMGTVEGVNTYCRTGDHRPQGMMMVRAAGVAPTHLNRTIPFHAFAPTLCALLGVDMPDADAGPVDEILTRLAETRELVHDAT